MNDQTPTSTDDAWAGERVARWLRQSAGLERQLQPVSDVLFAAAAIQPGEAVLDVGCGTGPTTRQAAGAAGADGRVTGLDVSADMLAAASRASDPEIAWVEADAVAWAPPSAAYDLLISRFGVMFFSNPVRALSNLATATRPGGRLAFAVWGHRTESPIFELPYRIAHGIRAERTGDAEELLAEDGPFRWHDIDAVAAMLEPAGWHDVASTPHRLTVPYAGGVGPAAAAAASLDFGPTRLVLAGADQATTSAVEAALTDAFAEHVDAAGHVVLEASIRIVTARR